MTIHPTHPTHTPSTPEPQVTETFAVDGMTCDHCARAVTSELTAIAGVLDVRVDVPTGQVTVTSQAPLTATDVRAAIDEAGYQLVYPSRQPRRTTEKSTPEDSTPRSPDEPHDHRTGQHDRHGHPPWKPPPNRAPSTSPA